MVFNFSIMLMFSRVAVLFVLQLGGSFTFEAFDDGFDLGDIFGKEETILAELIPPEVNLFTGDAVQIYGLFHDTNIYDTYFLIEGDNIKLNTSVVNATHVVTVLEGNEKTKGRKTLSLKGKRDRSMTEEEFTSMSFFVEERLQNVTNVSLVLYYSSKLLEVSWDYGVDYFDTQYIVGVETKWVSNDRVENGINNCSSSNNTVCKLDYKYETILFFHMIVKVIPQWWKLYVETKEYFITPQVTDFPHLIYRAEPKKYAQPGIPNDVKINARTSRCFNISWYNPQFFIDYKEDALLRITCKGEDSDLQSKTKIVNSRLTYGKDETVCEKNKFGVIVCLVKYTVCDLNPNTLYAVMVQLKPVDGGYWSKPADAFVTTHEDRPSYGPLMTNTSFWAGTCEKGMRNIIIYWRDLIPIEANGVLTNFWVEFNNESGEVRSSSNHIATHMPCSETLNVMVYSATSVGLTRNPSRLIIPKETDVLSTPFPVDLKVEKLTMSSITDLMDVNMTWNYQQLTSLQGSSLVIYFCQGQTFSSDLCIDDFQYRVVPLEKQYVELHNISKRTNRFGFALEKDRDNLSGISWTDCVYDRNALPQQVTDVSAHPGKAHGLILVVWKAQRCSKDTGVLVLLYQIQYCTRFQKCSVVDVEGGDSSSYTVSNLDMDETYTIHVRAKAWSGVGPNSQPVTSKPNDRTNDDSKATTIGVILGIICFLIMGSVVFCVMRFFNRRKQKMKESMPYAKMHGLIDSKGAETHRSDSGISTNTLKSTLSPTTHSNSKNGGDANEDVDPYVIINDTQNASQSALVSIGMTASGDSRKSQPQAVELEKIISGATRCEENMKSDGKDCVKESNSPLTAEMSVVSESQVVDAGDIPVSRSDHSPYVQTTDIVSENRNGVSSNDSNSGRFVHSATNTPFVDAGGGYATQPDPSSYLQVADVRSENGNAALSGTVSDSSSSHDSVQSYIAVHEVENQQTDSNKSSDRYKATDLRLKVSDTEVDALKNNTSSSGESSTSSLDQNSYLQVADLQNSYNQWSGGNSNNENENLINGLLQTDVTPLTRDTNVNSNSNDIAVCNSQNGKSNSIQVHGIDLSNIIPIQHTNVQSFPSPVLQLKESNHKTLSNKDSKEGNKSMVSEVDDIQNADYMAVTDIDKQQVSIPPTDQQTTDYMAVSVMDEQQVSNWPTDQQNADYVAVSDIDKQQVSNSPTDQQNADYVAVSDIDKQQVSNAPTDQQNADYRTVSDIDKQQVSNSPTDQQNEDYVAVADIDKQQVSNSPTDQQNADYMAVSDIDKQQVSNSPTDQQNEDYVAVADIDKQQVSNSPTDQQNADYMAVSDIDKQQVFNLPTDQQNADYMAVSDIDKQQVSNSPTDQQNADYMAVSDIDKQQVSNSPTDQQQTSDYIAVTDIDKQQVLNSPVCYPENVNNDQNGCDYKSHCETERTPDASSYVQATDVLKVENSLEESDNVIKEKSKVSIISSNSNNDYVDSAIMTQPPVCERKISEDEGISSPGFFTESPNYALKTGPAFNLPNPTSDHALTFCVDGQMVVDVSALSTLNDFSPSDIVDDEEPESNVAEVSGNSDNGYTNPRMLQEYNPDYV